MAIEDIKPSHLAEFLAKRWDMAASSVNRLSTHIKNAFEIAEKDSLLKENPYAKLTKEERRKRDAKKPPQVPTIEECEAIVASVRGQEFADTAERTADMLELMHRAVLGQAELIPLDWADVRWEAEKIIIWERKKTGEYFEVPFYPHLKPFLLDLWERHGKPQAGKVVSILTPAIALRNACKRLKLPHFSPRDFRKPESFGCCAKART
ncbi:MAG: site-specific integrase [Chthoniobacter sp.]